jgi:hypothetical protein
MVIIEKKKLAKFGYIHNIKIKILRILICSCQPIEIYHKNLTIWCFFEI